MEKNDKTTTRESRGKASKIASLFFKKNFDWQQVFLKTMV